MNIAHRLSSTRLTWKVAALLALTLAMLLLPAVALAQSPPATPDTVTVTRGDGTLTVSGYAVTGATKYHITYSSDGGQSWSAASDNHTGASITISGVDNSKTYIVGARAGNDAGWSGWRNSSSVGPYTPPAPPATPSAVSVSRADGTLTVSGYAVSGATKYHITYSGNGGYSWSAAADNHSGASITISGADNSKSYIVGVRAGNSAGWSGWRNSSSVGPFTPPSATPTPTPTPAPTTPPATPSTVTVTRGEGTLEVSGYAVTGATKYHITYSGDGKKIWTAASSSHTASSITISDIYNGGTYYVAVRAGNDAGWSGWRNSAASAPTNPPGIIVQDTSGNAITTLSVPEGGEASYQVMLASQPAAYVEICIGLSVRDRNDSSITFKGQPTGTVAIKLPFTPQTWNTAQTVTLVAAEDTDAVNGVRDVINDTRDFVEYFSGAVWLAVTEIDNDVPAAPTNLSVTPGDGYLDIAWDAVTDATGYDVRAKVSGTSSNSNWTDVASNITTTSYRYTTSATVDYVAVRARNASVPGPWTELSRLPEVDFVANNGNGVSNNVARLSMASGQFGGQIASSKPAKTASVTITRDNWPYDEKLFVTWSTVTGATGYNVVCSDKGGWQWWSCGTVSSGSTTTYTVDREIHGDINLDLKWRRSYRVAVQAVKNNVRGDWTDTEDAHPAFPPAVYYPITTERGTGSVALTWTSPPYAQGYEIDCATRENDVSSAYTRCADVETATVTNGKINATITSWTVSGTNYTIDDTKIYDLRVRTTNAWGYSDFSLAPLIHPNVELTVGSIGSTNAILTIANHTGDWYYKADKLPHNYCSSAQSGTTAILQSLSAGTTYTYKAYSDSACTTANLLATATAFTTSITASNHGKQSSGYHVPVNTTAAAQGFTTGGAQNGYTLLSVTLDFFSVSNASAITVSIREQQQNDQPATTDTVTLTGTAASGQRTFNCSGSDCDLEANTSYFVHIVGTVSQNNDALLNTTASDEETLQPGDNGWSIADALRLDSNSWGLHPESAAMKVELEASTR